MNKNKKGGILIVLTLFLLAFFALIMLIQIKYYMAYWKLQKEADDLITYAQPIGNGIKRDIYVIDQLAKGKLKIPPNDNQLLDLIYIKIEGSSINSTTKSFQIDGSKLGSELGKMGNKVRRVEYIEGKLRIRVNGKDEFGNDKELIIGMNDQRVVVNMENKDYKGEDQWEKWEELEREIGRIKENGREIIEGIKNEGMEGVKGTSEEYLKRVIKGVFEERERIKEIIIETNKWEEGVDINGDGIVEPDTFKHIIGGELKIRCGENREVGVPFGIGAVYKLEYLTLFTSNVSQNNNSLNITVKGYPVLRLIGISLNPNDNE
ncbi:MAG: hypothetical protein N2485_03880 [bacterium]|nr:hypothetical protein [bacterium]